MHFTGPIHDCLCLAQTSLRKVMRQFPPGWVQGDSFPEELQNECLGKRSSFARFAFENNSQKVLCNLFWDWLVHSVSCSSQCSMWILHVKTQKRTAKREEGLGVNKNFVPGMLAWISFALFFPLFIFGCSRYLVKDTANCVLFDTDVPSLPFSSFQNVPFLHVTVYFLTSGTYLLSEESPPPCVTMNSKPNWPLNLLFWLF